MDAELRQLAFMLAVAVSVAGLVLFLLLPLASSGNTEARVKAIASKQPSGQGNRRSRLLDGRRDSRRKQVQDTLKQIENREKKRKRLSLRMLIEQSGTGWTEGKFWAISAAVGVAIAVAVLLLGVPPYLCLAAGFVGFFGLPRWYLGFLRRRRQNKFLDELPDAIDIIVRGLKAGLPISDAMKVIAAESPDPIGPEFREVVEGQRVGITVEQGLERMFERMPLQEVSFLSIVMNLQTKTGGNLSEALNNLSRVLRDRKKMKAKVRAVSQESRSGAAIIAAMPLIFMLGIYFINYKFVEPLFTTTTGNMMLAFAGVWMVLGVLVMRKMINFDI